MKTLAIDIETYSSNDIKCGVHYYVAAPDFEILLFACAFDDEPVKIFDFAQGEELPDEVRRALFDPEITKTAYNAVFEITCLKTMFPELPDEQWECTSVLGLYNSYPAGLGVVAKALGFPEDKQKDTRGKALIKYFCSPVKATKSNDFRTRNMPSDAPDKWETFKDYCCQDVIVERAIRERLINNKPSDTEHELWLLDRRINDIGIMVDMDLIRNAMELDEGHRNKLMLEAMSITRLSNPNSVAQLKSWITERTGKELSSLDAEAVNEMLSDGELSDDVRRVLEIRKQLGKTSIKKYEAMAKSVCPDGRIHDIFQFYGAARTGRWSGRNVQLHNLRRNSLEDLDDARGLLQGGEAEIFSLLYDVPDTLSQLVRTALIAAPGKRFIVADFSAIEARVIAWMAGEEWQLETYRKGGDIYCQTASAMFKVPVEKNGANHELRQKGKIATLACGYQGGIGALKAMGAAKMGLTDEELSEIVKKWRESNPHIVQFWKDTETAAMRTISNGKPHKARCISFSMMDGNLLLTLPTGRSLVYVSPRIEKNKFDIRSITYKGLRQGMNSWGDVETYGGSIVENAVQAFARDCLAAAMLRLDAAGYNIVMHVHDEVIIEKEQGEGSLDDVIRIMTQNEEWNEGLPLDAAGFESTYYKKD
ncbi:MAG: DNA polymerase [Schwartzia sp.]|nr:DNA polymerase [Schwartzia sp. (in: firmicutes)]